MYSVIFPSVRKTLKVMCVRQMLSNREKQSRRNEDS